MNLDLSAYPVLRLDEIPRHSDDTLQRGMQDGRSLLASLQDDNSEDQRPMIRYLSKQLDAMMSEIAKRSAQNRILQMLSGEAPYPDSDIYKHSVSTKSSPRGRAVPAEVACPQPSSAPEGGSVGTSPVRPAIRQVPLPSEMRRDLCTVAPLAQEAEVNAAPQSISVSRRSNRSAKQLEGSPEKIELSSSESAPTFGYGYNAEGRKIPLASNPSKQSREALNNAFGVEFIVGATERKRRYIAKKVVKDPEEERDKNRQNR